MSATAMTICGKTIQHDKSGVGHCWVDADAEYCPASIQDEISAEIIDGKVEQCEDWVASNGLHYRWS